MTPTVTVVIVNWNGARHLKECLDSLRAQTLGTDANVVVVDNGSTDESLALLEQQSEFVRLIRNPDNRGFAAACNQGIRASRSEFVALLNNDAVVDSRWLEQLVRVMRQEPDIGFCASKILSFQDHHVFDNAGLVPFLDGLARGRGRLQPDSGQFEREEDIFAPSGCAVLLRRAMLEDVGGLDEHFKVYCEDVDLAFRARLRGWRCRYAPTAIAYHKFSATIGAFSPMKALLVERNRLWMVIKNLPLPLLVFTPLFTVYRYAWQAYGAYSGRGASGQFVKNYSRGALVLVLLRAHLQALAGLPRVLRQRREIQARRTASMREILTWLLRNRIGARQLAMLE